MSNRSLKGALQHFVRETFPREVLALVWRNRMVAHAGDTLPQETLSTSHIALRDHWVTH